MDSGFCRVPPHPASVTIRAYILSVAVIAYQQTVPLMIMIQLMLLQCDAWGPRLFVINFAEGSGRFKRPRFLPYKNIAFRKPVGKLTFLKNMHHS